MIKCVIRNIDRTTIISSNFLFEKTEMNILHFDIPGHITIFEETDQFCVHTAISRTLCKYVFGKTNLQSNQYCFVPILFHMNKHNEENNNVLHDLMSYYEFIETQYPRTISNDANINNSQYRTVQINEMYKKVPIYLKQLNQNNDLYVSILNKLKIESYQSLLSLPFHKLHKNHPLRQGIRFLLPSFVNFLHYLTINNIKNTKIVYRTFGDDFIFIKQELDLLSSGALHTQISPTFNIKNVLSFVRKQDMIALRQHCQFYLQNDCLEKVPKSTDEEPCDLDSVVAIPFVGLDLHNHIQNINLIQCLLQSYYFQTLEDQCIFIRDDEYYWKSQYENSNAGKLFIVEEKQNAHVHYLIKKNILECYDIDVRYATNGSVMPIKDAIENTFILESKSIENLIKGGNNENCFIDIYSSIRKQF